MERNYVVIVENRDGSNKSFRVKAGSLKKAKSIAAFHKRMEKLKGRVIVALVK